MRLLGVQTNLFESVWLVGMLLVSRSGLVEENDVEVFHHSGVHLSSSYIYINFKSFRGK